MSDDNYTSPSLLVAVAVFLGVVVVVLVWKNYQ